ncbi:hypothetical protein AK812_SmicGene1884 [Symbiodinium microadriaticum]|uniref:Vms1-associating treble clef domain-containing protein n=1 Tax=Symbiodinium microadriaticum TaxID=2951 RepID=A0A1Q9F339_SYMMI|nr:hypothetical protein AK812_SmicGene1884 [Symbiodinium microadriaticum]CAE7265586.1 unnamed protein product [Symbiodinium sp. KB8]CAE7872086.1 unnamed protein product [Symbiodinium microadriaticum]
MDPIPLVVMSVVGPVPPDALTAGPVLCREWLLNDQSTLLRSSSQASLDPGDVVQLSRLSAVRRWPLSTLHNLHLNQEDALQAASTFVREHGAAGLILVTTPLQFSLQPRTLLDITRETGMRIAVGTAPPQDLADFETCVSAVVSNLACGFSGSASTEPLRPGFIGEVPAENLELLAICVEAQLRSKAPLLLVGSVPREALTHLDRADWRKCAFFDVPDDSPVSTQEVQDRGAYVGFCAPPQAADVAWEDYPDRRPVRTEASFLEAIGRVVPSRLLLATGLRFRCDLQAFGGSGLGYAVELLRRGSVDELQCRANAAEFLSYPWQAPIAPEKVLHEIECHWCGKTKPDGEHFSKMGFDYCSPGCIAKHRRVDFEPSTCGIGKSHYGTGRWLLSLHLEALQCKLKPCPPVVQPWPTSQSV